MFTFKSFRSVSITGYDDLVDLLSRKKKTKIYYVLSRGRHSYLGCMDLSVDTFRNIPQNYKEKEYEDNSSRYIFGRYSSDTTEPFVRVVDTKDIGITYSGDSRVLFRLLRKMTLEIISNIFVKMFAKKFVQTYKTKKAMDS